MDIYLNAEFKADDYDWKYFFRQLYVCSGVCSFFFLIGLNCGAPTVYIPQMRREANTTSVISDEMASWLCSVSGFSAVPFLFALAYVSRYIGRKAIFIIANVDMVVALLILYFSSTPTQLLISHIIMGLSYATSFTNNILIVTEYASPKNRGLFLALKSTSVICGIWGSNAIGTFFHWKYIAISGLLVSFFAFTAFSWPESPYWLASRGRYEECRTAFIWLNGRSREALNELETLIESDRNTSKSSCWSKSSFKSLLCTEFYKPIFISSLLIIQYHFSGKYVCSIYALDIIKKMTGSESAAYIGMLILDGVTLFSMYIGCLLARVLKRRTLYLTASAIGIFFLFVISLYLYLVRLSVVKEDRMTSILLLACFSIPISCGPMNLNTSIHGEILPARFKTIGVLITGLLFEALMATTLKVAPLIFQKMGLDGAFLFYGVMTGLCFLFLFKYLPETKDKTLQEIEQLFKGKSEKKEVESERLYIEDS